MSLHNERRDAEHPLRTHRIDARLSIKELAARTGGCVSAASISAYENGARSPKVAAARCLATALDVPVGVLFEAYATTQKEAV